MSKNACSVMSAQAQMMVALTCVLMPFAVFELIEHLSASGAAVLAVNVAIVAWLLRRQSRGPAR